MSYRGLWIATAFIGAGLLAFEAVPAPSCRLVTAGCLRCAFVAGGVFAVDYYRHIKRFETERHEFNRRLRERR